MNTCKIMAYLRKNSFVQKHLYPYSWISGSSTKVYPIQEQQACSTRRLTIGNKKEGDKMVDWKNAEKIIWTEEGLEEANRFIRECEAKRKEILDAGLDTADGTNIPTIEDIESDIFTFYDEEEKEYYNGWGVTDEYNSDLPLCLVHGRDFVFG